MDITLNRKRKPAIGFLIIVAVRLLKGTTISYNGGFIYLHNFSKAYQYGYEVPNYPLEDPILEFVAALLNKIFVAVFSVFLMKVSDIPSSVSEKEKRAGHDYYIGLFILVTF
ncbi:MAG: hypothetical protein QXS27_05710 [Candidatus Jordarchaeaceae archaeon]